MLVVSFGGGVSPYFLGLRRRRGSLAVNRGELRGADHETHHE